MGFSTSTCTEFVEVLASKAPVPAAAVHQRWLVQLELHLAIW